MAWIAVEDKSTQNRWLVIDHKVNALIPLRHITINYLLGMFK